MAFDLWKFLGFRQDPGGNLSGMGGARSTSSKVVVTLDVALQTSAFLRAMRVVAEGMGSMPLKLFEEDDDDQGRTIRKVARKHKSFRAICYVPCWLTRTEFVETLTMHAFVKGDGFALINRGGGDKDEPIEELLPLLPGQCEFRLNKDWEPEYVVTIGQYREVLTGMHVLHIRGPSWDGRVGMNILEKAREAIGLSRALEQTHGALMGTEARPAGVLTTSGSVTKEVADKIREAWQKAYGPNGTKGVAVLDNGYSFSKISVDAVDSQYIENRRFQIEEIARATGVFPQMLMHVDKTATFASSSEFFAAHVKYTMLPWVNRWEEALKRDAIGWKGKNADIWPRFTMDVLLRAAPKERGEFYKIMIGNGIMNSNEIRALENLNPRDGGDEYLTPMNMSAGDPDPQQDPEADPPKDPPPPKEDPEE